MKKHCFTPLLAIISCLLLLTGCDIKLVDTTANASTSAQENTSQSESSEGSETTAPESDDDAWKTATLSETETAPPVTMPPLEETTTEITTTEDELDLELSLTTPSEETTIKESEPSETEEEKEETTTQPIKLDYTFDATVLVAERKYIIVKPDKQSDEFEISRKIVVYCSNAIDFSTGDNITVKYSGEFGADKDDMPTIEISECVLVSDGEDLPEFMTKNKKIEVEVIRVYSDGFLAKLTDDSADFEAGTKINVNTKNIDSFEKGQILSIEYSQTPETAEDDYPSITTDDITIKSTPSYIIGKITSINDKGLVISYESGTFDAPEGSDIIVISDNISDVSEGDSIKLYFDDNIEGEPYIIYNVTDYNIL